LTRVLAEGATLDSAAARLGLRIGTVRTRLKTIFDKTGTHRQADLVRLVLLGSTHL
jgi:DNA-binding CsgD family transcriptional regulator